MPQPQDDPRNQSKVTEMRGARRTLVPKATARSAWRAPWVADSRAGLALRTREDSANALPRGAHRVPTARHPGSRAAALTSAAGRCSRSASTSAQAAVLAFHERAQRQSQCAPLIAMMRRRSIAQL
eukprot:Amastigsp_a8556_4.p3 type:complete len:126 gc:universal Amastigsp_a8556_4:669-292(-)